VADIGTATLLIGGGGLLATVVSVTWGLTYRSSNKMLCSTVERLEHWTGDQETRVRNLEVKAGALEGTILSEIRAIKDRLTKIEKHMNGKPG